MLRQPAVAGQFYSLDPAQLDAELDACLPKTETARQAFGVVVPHAGYVYSGPVAGEVFARVEVPQQTILLGPNHHGFGPPAAVYPEGTWLMPGRNVAVDAGLVTELLQSCPGLVPDVSAHRHEHSLEVQVPFLCRRRPDVAIVPICLGHLGLRELLELGRDIAAVISELQSRPLLVSSSDMTHYEPGDSARHKDQLAIDHILDIDPEGLYRVVRDRRITMCGVLPTVVLLAAARELGVHSAELVRYSNSGDVTGDQSEVVGYAGLIVG